MTIFLLTTPVFMWDYSCQTEGVLVLGGEGLPGDAPAQGVQRLYGLEPVWANQVGECR